MNINDVKMAAIKLGEGDRLDQIFGRQMELLQKYHDIERKNGLLVCEDVPVNLHDARGQFRLKDFAWRITEELGEAIEAFKKHPEMKDHYDEELSDALHFLVEFSILAGLDLNRFDNEYDKLLMLFDENSIIPCLDPEVLTKYVGKVVCALAITCNCLKNKPWKNTQMLTDTDYFYSNLMSVWDAFAKLCQLSDISAEKMFELYFRKSEVNKFRQRSNY